MIIGTIFGDIWFFDSHLDTDIVDKIFCNFLDDPRDKKSLRKKDFIDLGDL